MSRSHAWSRVLITAALLSLCGCGAEPTLFSRDEPIPLGEMTMTVSRSTLASSSYFSQVPLLSDPSRRVLVVFFRADGVEGRDTPELIHTFIRALSVEDDAQDEYRAAGAMPAKLYQGLKSMAHAQSANDLNSTLNWMSVAGSERGAPRSWVALFSVPKDSNGFELRIDNPGRGEPRLASVALGR